MNNLAFNGAVCALQHIFIGGRLRYYLAYFAPLTVLCIRFDAFNAVFMPVIVLCSFLITWPIQPDHRIRLFGSVGGVFVVMLFVLGVGNTATLIAPGLMVSLAFNYAMAGATLALGVVGHRLLRWLLSKYALTYDTGPAAYLLLATELLVILLYSIVLPRFPFSNTTLFDFASVVLAIILTVMLANYLRDALLRAELRGVRAMQSHLRQKAQEGAHAKHFALRAIHGIGPYVKAGDMPGLRKFIEQSDLQHTIPFKGEMFMFAKVDDPALKNTLQTLTQRMDAEGIQYTVNEAPTAPLPPAVQEDVCNVVAQLGSNAITYLKTQPQAMRWVTISCVSHSTGTLVEIINAVDEAFQLATVTGSLLKQHSTPLHGLELISNLIHRHKARLTLSAFVEGKDAFTGKSGWASQHDGLVMTLSINSTNPGYGEA